METDDMTTTDQQRARLQKFGENALAGFADKHAAREKALKLSREVIRSSANSIRATQRGNFQQAQELIDTAAETVREMERSLEGQPSVYYAGYVEDGQKEFVEANAILAFTQGTPLPAPEDLNVGPAPYLNGLAEAVGELRRFILDMLRGDDVSRCEELLQLMDEVYAVLVLMDFPEAVTRGLRRNTDMVRGVTERTRGDLTMALRQRRLEEKLDAFQQTVSTQGNLADD